MFELESELRNWRTRVERGSSLSPRELDELEDHLRARVDLELELDASLAPRRAFAIARHALGEPKALSREFAQAGRPRWKHLLLAGWALYAVSFLLPVASTAGVVSPSGHVADFTTYGYQLFVKIFVEVLRGGEIGPPLTVLLLNLPMLMTLPALWRSRRWKAPWLLVMAVGVGALGYGSLWPPTVTVDGVRVGSAYLGFGYWAWAASLALASVALWLRRRNWASARSSKTAIRV